MQILNEQSSELDLEGLKAFAVVYNSITKSQKKALKKIAPRVDETLILFLALDFEGSGLGSLNVRARVAREDSFEFRALRSPGHVGPEWLTLACSARLTHLPEGPIRNLSEKSLKFRRGLGSLGPP